ILLGSIAIRTDWARVFLDRLACPSRAASREAAVLDGRHRFRTNPVRRPPGTVAATVGSSPLARQTRLLRTTAWLPGAWRPVQLCRLFVDHVGLTVQYINQHDQ